MNAKIERSLQTWRATLEGLLTEARTAAQNDDFPVRIETAEKLQDFIVNNPPSQSDVPETAEFDEMDRIARNAHDALLLGTLTERVAAIVSQNAELAGLTKKIQSQTAANEKAARSLRLEKAQKLVESLTDSVAAIKALQEQLSSQAVSTKDEVELGKKLTKAIEGLQSLREAVEATD